MIEFFQHKKVMTVIDSFYFGASFLFPSECEVALFLDLMLCYIFNLTKLLPRADILVKMMLVLWGGGSWEMFCSGVEQFYSAWVGFLSRHVDNNVF